MANGNVSTFATETKDSPKPQEPVKPEPKPESPTVKVVGVEMTASNEDGSKWSRPTSPLVPPTPVVEKVPEPEPQSIFLEGTLPAKSQLLVSESATEKEVTEDEDESAIVLSSKLTLSVINLENIDRGMISL